MGANRILIQLPNSTRQIELDGDEFTWPNLDKRETVSFFKHGETGTESYRVESLHIAYELDDSDTVIRSEVFMQLEEC